MKTLKLIPLTTLTFALMAANVIAAPAGRADFANGDVTVRLGSGAERKLIKGAEIQSGETIRTGADGRVQLRMTDDSYMSLVPNTQFTITDYKFEGRTDGTESVTYNLVRGALRTVTGLIGRVNRDKYKMVTPTATVGIRGTGGEIAVTDTETRIRGTSGTWTMTNQFGSLEVPAGQSAVANIGGPPTTTSTPPNVSAPPTSAPTTTVQTTQSSGEQRTSSTQVAGVPVVVPEVLRPTPLPAAGPFSLNVQGIDFINGVQTAPRRGAFGSLQNGDTEFQRIGGVFIDNPSNPRVIRANGVAYTVNSAVSAELTPFRVATAEFSAGTATILEAGTLNSAQGIDVNWGRFTNGTVTLKLTENGVVTSTTTRTLSGNQGVHAVYGTETPISAMPTSGTLTYTFIGGTKPTTFDGSIAPGALQSGNLAVNFTAMSAQMGFTVVFPTASFTAQGNAQLTGNNVIGLLGVTGSGNGASIQGGTNCTASTCGARVDGTFFGSAANALGAAYTIRRTDVPVTNSIDGTIIFRK